MLNYTKSSPYTNEFAKSYTPLFPLYVTARTVMSSDCGAPPENAAQRPVRQHPEANDRSLHFASPFSNLSRVEHRLCQAVRYGSTARCPSI